MNLPDGKPDSPASSPTTTNQEERLRLLKWIESSLQREYGPIQALLLMVREEIAELESEPDLPRH